MDYSALLTVVLAIGAWFILGRWILPIFGIRTCWLLLMFGGSSPVCRPRGEFGGGFREIQC